jgi:hypothetical protein
LIFLFLSLAPGLFVYSPLESYFDPTTQEENQLATRHQHTRRPDFARKIMNRDDERVEEIFRENFQFFSENLLASSTQASEENVFDLFARFLAGFSLSCPTLLQHFFISRRLQAHEIV